MLKIHLKDPAQAELANQKLKKLGRDYKSEDFPVVFNSPETVQWQFVEYYNSDAHLSSPNCIRVKSEMTQGEDRDVTAEECMKYWNIKLDGIGRVDIAYDRCPEDHALILVLFISGNIDLIEKVEDGLELLEKSGMDTSNPEGKKILEAFEKLEYVYEPEMLPEEKRTKRDLQGGVFLAKYWSVAPHDFVHVAFGAVDSPRFMKDRQFVDDIHNNLYKCDDGRGVLLVPQIPLDNTAGKIAEEAFNKAWELGVRENPYYFIHMIWKNAFKVQHSKSTIHNMADSFIDTYNAQELKDRMLTVAKHLNTTYPEYRKVNYDPAPHRWKRFSYGDQHQNTMVCLLNALYVACDKLSTNLAASAVQEITAPVEIPSYH